MWFRFNWCIVITWIPLPPSPSTAIQTISAVFIIIVSATAAVIIIIIADNNVGIYIMLMLVSLLPLLLLMHTRCFTYQFCHRQYIFVVAADIVVSLLLENAKKRTELECTRAQDHIHIFLCSHIHRHTYVVYYMHFARIVWDDYCYYYCYSIFTALCWSEKGIYPFILCMCGLDGFFL